MLCQLHPSEQASVGGFVLSTVLIRLGLWWVPVSCQMHPSDGALHGVCLLSIPSLSRTLGAIGSCYIFSAPTLVSPIAPTS